MRLMCYHAFKRMCLALLCVVAVTVALRAQDQKEIKGIVSGPDGQPLAGVSVFIKGKSVGATSNDKGAFSLKAGANDVLIFSSANAETQEIAVGNKNVITISLKQKVADLGDVVVVGYGKNSRKTLVTTVTSLKPEDLNKGAITDVGQLLQGKVPGLNITASGDPNKPAAVTLRGASTINSPGGPFYVIDGIPGADISTIAPDDIASIDVLKDAAATAIYGNRASNGVIMVTTKRAKKGAAQVTYGGYVGAEKVSSQLHVMNADQLRSFVATNNQSLSTNDDKGANTNWLKELERPTAISTNHNIGLSQGSDHGSFNASLNYVKKQGIIQNSDLTRVIARLGVEQYTLNDKLRLGLNVTNSYSNGNDVPYLGVMLQQAAKYLPVSPVKNPDGTYFEDFSLTNYYNPVAMMNNSQMNNKINNLIGSATAHAILPFGLTYDLVLSYQNSSTLHGEYYNSYFTNNYNNLYNNPDPGAVGKTQQVFGKNGQAVRSSYQNTSKVLETFVTWNRKFGNHSVNAVLGYSWQDNINNDGFQVNTFNFPVDNVAYNNFALSAPYAYATPRISFGPDGLYQQTRLISDFFRVNYNYKEKYMLQGSVRRDGSSVFGTNNQWGYFPSIGGAWRISQENFMKNQHLINDLKLRASYGETGNALGFNAYTSQYFSGVLGTFYYNGVQTSAYGPTQAANPDLKWEKTAMANIGLDFSLLKNLVNVSLDVYNKNTTNMIFAYKVDPILVPSGTITANGGSINNKGIELTLNATPVRKRNFTWNTSLNLAHNVNKITSLNNPNFAPIDSIPVADPEGAGQTGIFLQALKAGYPIGQFYTWQYAGKDGNNMSQFIDRNGKTTLNPALADRAYLGNAQPKLLIGWSNNFKYKNFDLNVFFRGVLGNKIFDATRADLFRPGTATTANILADAKGEALTDMSYKYSTRFIENGSYVRLDNATLGYNFKLQTPYIKSLRVYASGNNLLVITKYKGIDPEITQGGIAPGVDYNNFYPKTRTFLMGVNVAF